MGIVEVDTGTIFVVKIISSVDVTFWHYKWLGHEFECYKYAHGFVLKDDYDQGLEKLRRMLFFENGKLEIVNQYKIK